MRRFTTTYGPTEATVAVTSIQITQEILDQYPTLPVGVERPGARLSTTDEGELVIEGQSVSLGYLKNDQKQLKYLISMTVFVLITLVIKAKFENGQWFIQGRIDFQIKLNGYRMELEEIETQLRQSEFVKEATVETVYIKMIKFIHSFNWCNCANDRSYGQRRND